MISDIKYKKYSVIGAARSGVAVAKLLQGKGFNVFLSEYQSKGKIKSTFINELESNNINCEFGGHSVNVYNCDAMIVSPGIPQYSEIIQIAVNKGIQVFSELEVASWFCPGKIVSITGTNGKTTTTTLIGEIFNGSGLECFVCGNIGTAFSDVVSSMTGKEIAAVETSSFQLDNIKYFKPDIAVLMNITPDHLDRYDNNLSNYIDSKFKIIKNQTTENYLIYNYDDPVITDRISYISNTTLVPFSIKKILSDNYIISAYWKDNIVYVSFNGSSENVLNTDKLIFKGMHNVYNSMAAILSAKIFNVSNKSICNTLYNFTGVEHRLEYIKEYKGIKFYNDSKATNVDSVWFALQGFQEPIVLILGGRDKGNDYNQIKNEVEKYVKKIIAVGESKEKVFNFFKSFKPVEIAEDFNDAVVKAYSSAISGDIVLLSPACASFDQFENYEQRGTIFKKLVNSINY